MIKIPIVDSEGSPEGWMVLKDDLADWISFQLSGGGGVQLTGGLVDDRLVEGRFRGIPMKKTEEIRTRLRGHLIEWRRGQYVYSDTGEPTVGNRRSCGHCGLPDTEEGHDGCLGALPNVKNACCGHGEVGSAYIQYGSGRHVKGEAAAKELRKMNGRGKAEQTVRRSGVNPTPTAQELPTPEPPAAPPKLT